MMNDADLIALAETYGGEWSIRHAERIIKLVDVLADGARYDRSVVFRSAYLHDWGAYPQWAVAGVDHAVRSVEVVTSFLAEQGVSPADAEPVIECIRYHHGGSAARSVESVLFTDADALDLLGVVGTIRVFAMNPRNLRAGYEGVQRFRDVSMSAITTERGKAIARERVTETNQLLRQFEDETFGLF